MSKVENHHLLSAVQMAQFAVNGFLQLENLVPQELNEAVHAEQQAWKGPGSYWSQSKLIKDVFELPQVKGVLQSLVGAAPVYDHSALHIVSPQHHHAQNYHADSVIDTRPFAFDIQAFYFSHDTPEIMGPTLILPGSHLHNKVNTGSISHYKNILGQRKLVSKAGTIGFLHHAIWHCAQPNYTDEARYVFKLRLRPGQEQRSLFNIADYNGPEVAQVLNNYHDWAGNDARLNQVAAAKFYRYLCGDDRVDFSFEGIFTRMGI
ncbi:hypothetical protein Back11_51570 [Paenibacillus baekrokdamisoli]|uniref:Uncharacterized protein n=1 Tax=Paenibacillus baekrokdamisoli TaxID=1712516 RepID=A0A3G9IZT3_9BACL|nr:phytanoyl-CoA dioxygenase family protein [Paenibacillus baekrokdamisoli]MBB3068990.1 hypothetical protein [Paenibacillus baekrokdamisoli]BBH23812.1 hypothetical protein Back11_51570 [Paenibacillus baekrokdamisoli]